MKPDLETKILILLLIILFLAGLTRCAPKYGYKQHKNLYHYSYSERFEVIAVVPCMIDKDKSHYYIRDYLYNHPGQGGAKWYIAKNNKYKLGDKPELR